MKHALFVCLLFGILACPGLSQSSGDGKNYGDSRNENLRNCFAGLGACDPSALRSDQAKQIADMRHDQNLWKCLDGYGECDHTALAESEAKEVADAKHQRNLLARETGYGLCDRTLLRAEEARQIGLGSSS